LKVVVVGAGFAGACAARMLQARGAHVSVFERGSRPGGMLETLRTPEGIPYEYGPRILSVFRGTPELLPFIRQFANLEERAIYQGTRLLPEYPIIPFPVDRASLKSLPCGEQIQREWQAIEQGSGELDRTNLKTYLESSVGPTLTRLAFEGFNHKFWGRALEDMPAAWGQLRRLHRIAESGEFRLPSVAPHYYPRGGFNPIFAKMLTGIEVRYDTPILGIEADGGGVRALLEEDSIHADLVVSTAPIDAMLGQRFGPLAWSGYRTEVEIRNAGRDLGRASDGTPFAWLYSPWPETPVCRTTDFGVIHEGGCASQPHVVLKEIPDPGVKMYPVWWEADRFSAYLRHAAAIRGLVPLGRLGMYKYLTTDSTLGMVQRFIAVLEDYLGADDAGRLDVLGRVRGAWQN
jgi:UDP-galactopyranose mutase